MVNMITTVGGWTLMGVIGYTYWWKYSNDRARRRGPPTRPERDDRKKGSEKVEFVSEAESAGPADKLKQRKKNKAKTQPTNVAASSAVDTTPAAAAEPNTKRKEADDLAFARQLASTQQGTNLKTAETHAGKVRTNKVRGLERSEAVGDTDKKWHSAGANSSPPVAEIEDEGEDEAAASPPSPALAPTNASKNDGHGISDMLEAPAPGPATLRLIPSEKPQRPSKPAAPKKPAQEPETKKQRQRRKKREAEKSQLAEDESQRRVLLERQLKTARTLEGTAKSGQYRNPLPSSNAWQTAGSAATEVTKGSSEPLLDTFDPDHQPNLPISADQVDVQSDASRASLESEPRSSGQVSEDGGYEHHPVIADSAAPGDTANDWEDYQLRALRDQEKADAEWQEVAPRKGKKAVK